MKIWLGARTRGFLRAAIIASVATVGCALALTPGQRAVLFAAGQSAFVTSVPSNLPGVGISSKSSTALESSHAYCSAGCNFYGGEVVSTSISGWAMLIDGTAAPSAGALVGCGDTAHATGCVAKWWPIQTGPSVLGIAPGIVPIALTNGAVLIFSSTGPFVNTASATAVFSGEFK
jgi:hypothetical protein